jgi:hypothetical protein
MNFVVAQRLAGKQKALYLCRQALFAKFNGAVADTPRRLPSDFGNWAV